MTDSRQPGKWRRRLQYGGFAVVFCGIGALGLGGLNTAMHATSSTEFCISCHEMKDTVYEEYKTSPHYANASGVRAGCGDCHVDKNWVGLVEDKILAVNDIYHTAIGSIDTPEKFEAKRLTLAKHVWAKFKADDSHNCRSCHSYEGMDFHKQKPEAAVAMEKASKDGGTCIDCHKGVAHKMPDVASGYRAMFDELMAQSKDADPKPGDTVYTLATTAFSLTRPAGDAGEADGKLLAATPLKVIARDGQWLQVAFGGWRQEGAEKMIYALQGKRIFVAALGPDAVGKVVSGPAVMDADTEQNWSEAKLTGWVKNEGLIADHDKLWAYGAELYGTGCGLCHAQVPLDHYLANQWIGTLNAMKRFVSFDDEQYRFLQKYVQLNAQDTGAKK